MTRVLSAERWQSEATAHAARIDSLIGPYLAARRRGEKHPVIDFLFTYYNTRPAQLRRWHPGYGVALAPVPGRAGTDGYLTLGDYHATSDGTVTVTDHALLRRRDLLLAVTDLLAATASRPARFGCFGLHEWAMVYRTPQPRHTAVPLRLGAAATDAVVESMPLRCTHYDAFRFFTPAARPRNAATLDRAGQRDHEQPGCLHATMDLYRHSLKLAPLLPGDLLADAFELALDARTLDMRASPYDLSALGYTAVTVETPDGRAEYVRVQTTLAERGAHVRRRLLDSCRDLLHNADRLRTTPR